MHEASKIFHSNELKDTLTELKEAIVDAPLQHPLGFVSLEVAQGENWKLTLHYWPKNKYRKAPTNSIVHSHGCHIKSRIIAGTLQNNIYRVEKGYNHTLYSVEYAGKNSKLKSTSTKVNKSLVSSSLYKAGSIYSVPHGTFHHIAVPCNVDTITLVLQYGFSYEPPLVLGGDNTSLEICQRTVFDQEDFWETVLRFS